MRAVLLTLLLAACGPGLKHHRARNAPGLVDLDTPPARQTADPKSYEVPADPGENALGLGPGLSAQFGAGRLGADAVTVELAAQLHVSFQEREYSLGRGAVGYPWDTWGATVGWAFLQITEDDDPSTTGDSDVILGPIYAEVTRQWLVFSAGAGLALYPTPGEVAGGRAEGVAAGAQVSFMAEPFGVRIRVVQDTGFEIFAGYQLELPYSVSWSR